MILSRTSSSIAIILALGWTVPSFAQDTPAPETSGSDQSDNPVEDDYHEDGNEGIVVIGAGVRPDFLSGVDTLTRADLTKALRPSLGETLTDSPGVSATSFGPSASRPVLRGLQGERVHVLTDGLGAIDVSNTSVDHAVVIDPLLAESVEVLRGPQSLLYGSAAVGGIVNVRQKRIPMRAMAEDVHIDALANYGSAANERSVAGSVDAAIGSRFVVHADGSYLKSDDLRIGGFALAPSARAEALATAQLLGPPDPADPEAIDYAGNAAIRDILPNSSSKTTTYGIGAAFIDERGTIGASYSRYDSIYGLPLRYATLPGQEQEGPLLSMAQDKFDLKAEANIGGFLDTVRFRYTYADYTHDEIEEDGEVGTTFSANGMEGRLELAQAIRGGWTGTSGVQFYNRNFNVVGEEAFLPRNRSETLAAFTVQQVDLDPLKVEFGARYEDVSHRSLPLANQPQFARSERNFDTFSAAIGASYRVADDWTVGMNLSRNERAPAAEELFANGPHKGTQSFEVGDTALVTEKTWSIEALLRGGSEDLSIELALFHNRYDDFVYESRTGAIEDGLPVFAFRQADARFYGAEIQAKALVARVGNATVKADVLADVVRGTIKSIGPVPRIPPLRLLGGIEYSGERVDLRAEAEWVDDQTRTAAFETPTDGHTLVNLEASWRPWGTSRPLSFVVSVNNIFDVTARRHASFLKDFAPLAGRDIRISARLSL